MSEHLEKKINSHEAIIGVIGMGYIGCSLLEVFGYKGYSLIGYDVDPKKVEMMQREASPFNHMDLKALFSLIEKKRFRPTCDPHLLKEADILVISVPTSLDDYYQPNLLPLERAFQTVQKSLRKDQLIVLQSTTYPGTTVEVLLPLLNQSTLKVGHDFFLTYVPEVSDIGNPDHTFTQIPRIISGITSACLKMGKLLYQNIGCQIVEATSTQVAESAKILQNAYRLVNCALINELKITFDRLGIDIWEVIQAASSKPFGFTPFYPGPGAGGDCIPVDPQYLIWKARKTDGPTTLLENASAVNREIPYFVVDKVIQGLDRHQKSLKGAKILLLGIGYKKDVNDVRQSASLKILSLLRQRGANVFYHDPFISEIDGLKSRDLHYVEFKDYDAIVIATDHSIYDWKAVVLHSQLIIDTRNVTTGIPGAHEKVIKG